MKNRFGPVYRAFIGMLVLVILLNVLPPVFRGQGLGYAIQSLWFALPAIMFICLCILGVWGLDRHSLRQQARYRDHGRRVKGVVTRVRHFPRRCWLITANYRYSDKIYSAASADLYERPNWSEGDVIPVWVMKKHPENGMILDEDAL